MFKPNVFGCLSSSNTEIIRCGDPSDQLQIAKYIGCGPINMVCVALESAKFFLLSYVQMKIIA